MKRELNITTPENLNDITVAQYQSLIELKEPTPEQLIELFYKVPEQLIQYLPADKVDEFIMNIGNILQEQSEFSQTFTIGKTKFGFIPNLENITYGENRDITSYIGSMKEIHKAMAVMYRPITKEYGNTYEIEEYAGSSTYAEVMKVAPAGVMLGAIFFFFHLTEQLLNATQSYLMLEIEKTKTTTDLSQTQLSSLEKSGEIIKNYMNSLKEMSEDTKRSLNFRYNNV